MKLLWQRDNKTFLTESKKFIAALPFTVPLFVACFSVIAVTLLVLDFYRTSYVLLFGLSLSLIVTFAAYKRISPHIKITSERLVATVAMLIICLTWFVWNANYTSQHVYVDRDPGTYANAAIWLIDHENLRIEHDGYIFGDNPELRSKSSGFNPSAHHEGALDAQGAHAYPALLSLFGRAGGPNFMFHANPVFGALALLSVFGFASMLYKRQRWALFASILLSVTLPLIYFSRDMYSEPLALAFVFAALSWLYLAQKSSSKFVWLVAGLVAGAGALTRIDALLSILGLFTAAFIIALVSRKKEIHWLKNLSLFIVTTVIIFFLGLYDLYYLSNGYLNDHVKLFYAQTIVGAILVAVGYVVVSSRQIDSSIRKFYFRFKTKILISTAYLTGTIMLLMVSRPLWYQGREAREILHVQLIQVAQGMPVDGARSYAENSMEWLVWYIGAVTVILALIGFIVISMNVVKSKNILWVSFAAVAAGSAAVYLNFPSITADQIWASRRFLPVVIPCFIIAAFYALDVAYEKKNLLKKRYRRHASAIVYAMFAFCAVGTLTTTAPFITTRVFDRQLFQVQEVCKELPADSALLMTGNYSITSIQTVRSVCGDIAVGFMKAEGGLSDSVIGDINESVRSNGKKLYIGSLTISENGGETLESRNVKRPFNSLTFYDYEYTLIRRPVSTKPTTAKFYLASVDSRGELEAVYRNE